MLLRQMMRQTPSMASIYHVLIFCNHKSIFNFQPISLAIDLIASEAKKNDIAVRFARLIADGKSKCIVERR